MSIISVGKKAGFLNVVYVGNPSDINKFPETVRSAISIVDGKVKVDSREYAEGELIPFGSYIAYEPCEHPNCPRGWNLWHKSNMQKQLAEGIVEKVDGKYRSTKIVPYKAELYTGEIPGIFESAPTFEGQITSDGETLSLVTPWGISTCKKCEGFAILYGIYPSTDPDPFAGKVNGNILTVGTASFEAYYHLDDEGNIIETLREYYDKL